MTKNIEHCCTHLDMCHICRNFYPLQTNRFNCDLISPYLFLSNFVILSLRTQVLYSCLLGLWLMMVVAGVWCYDLFPLPLLWSSNLSDGSCSLTRSFPLALCFRTLPNHFCKYSSIFEVSDQSWEVKLGTEKFRYLIVKISFLKNEHTISRWPINFFVCSLCQWMVD